MYPVLMALMRMPWTAHSVARFLVICRTAASEMLYAGCGCCITRFVGLDRSDLHGTVAEKCP